MPISGHFDAANVRTGRPGLSPLRRAAAARRADRQPRSRVLDFAHGDGQTQAASAPSGDVGGDAGSAAECAASVLPALESCARGWRTHFRRTYRTCVRSIRAERASSPWCKWRVAPRRARRRDGKARQPRIPNVFEGGATPPARMHRPANAAALAPRWYGLLPVSDAA